MGSNLLKAIQVRDALVEERLRGLRILVRVSELSDPHRHVRVRLVYLANPGGLQSEEFKSASVPDITLARGLASKSLRLALPLRAQYGF